MVEALPQAYSPIAILLYTHSTNPGKLGADAADGAPRAVAGQHGVAY